MAEESAKVVHYAFKVVLVGDSGVGKSSLLVRFADDCFNGSFISTIGVDFRFRTLEIDGKRVKLQIWDTAGQEVFRALTHTYYRQANGIILVYDATSMTSFDNLSSWLGEISRYATQDPCTLLVGNKADLTRERQVPSETASAFAAQQGLMFLETSAKTAENVHATFDLVAKELVKTANEKNPDAGGSSVNLKKDSDEEKACCF